MKAVLIFDLENPEDREAHLRCTKATDMAIAIFEIQNLLHRFKDSDMPISDLLDGIEERLSDINLDELIS